MDFLLPALLSSSLEGLIPKSQGCPRHSMGSGCWGWPGEVLLLGWTHLSSGNGDRAPGEPRELCSFPSLPAWMGLKQQGNDPCSPGIPSSCALMSQQHSPPCTTAALQLGLKKHFCSSGLEPKIPLGVTHINVSRTAPAKQKGFFFVFLLPF